MIDVRLHFIFFENEISDLYTQWIEFDSSTNFKEISAILKRTYRPLLHETVITMKLNKDWAENLITQINEGKGKVNIEIRPITLK